MTTELIYNHMELCTFLYNGNTQAAIHCFKENSAFFYKSSTLKMKVSYLHSLNLSIYNYILIKEKVSLHRCCHENEQRIGRDASSHNFYDIGEEILLAYGNCSEYLIEKHKNKHVRKAVAYIHSNLGEALSLEEVCSNININRCYFSELFKKQVKCSFRQYVLKQRILLAKKLLKDSQLTVHMISEKCGFTNHSYFCTCFKKEAGMSPCAYRSQRWEKIS